MFTETTNNVVKASKRGCVQVVAWIDPQGTVCTAIDSAIAAFERLNITVTRKDRQTMKTAIDELSNN